MLSIQNGSFQYANATAPSLHSFNLDVAAGELVVLAGPSGCGKTTATRLINGLIPHFFPGHVTGSVDLNGTDPRTQPMWATAALTGSVFQNPRAQFFTTDLAAEIAFGCENLGLPRAETRDRVADAIAAFELGSLADRSIFALSGGEKQRLACAAVAAMRPQLMVLDEPSANLDQHASNQLAVAMERWKNHGIAVVVAEHRLDYLRHLVDRVVLMDAGRVVGELTGAELRELDTAALHARGLRHAVPAALRAAPTESTSAVTVHNFAYQHRRSPAPGARQSVPAAPIAFDALEFPTGRVTALTGANGVGKSTLLRWMAGITRARSGRLVTGSRPLSRAARRRNVFLVLQDVNHQLVTESVADELDISLRVARCAPHARSRRRAQILERMDLTHVANSHPMALSGGEKQRLAIGTALASDRPIVALDEPTSGLDLRHMQEVAHALRELAAAGRTVVVATHDTELIQACAHHVVQLAP